jgi:hypothetical protein
MMRALAFLCLLLAACGKSTPSPEKPHASPATTMPDAPAPSLSADAVVSARSLGLHYGQPPLVTHRFDVSLRNPASYERWLVLPATFPYETSTHPAPGEGSLAELQLFLLSESPRVVLAKGVGGAFWAIRLPAHGDLVLRRLPIESWWPTTPPEVAIDVLVAREFTVDGAPLASQTGGDPTCGSGADVLAPDNAGDKRALPFWHADKDSKGAMNIDVDSRARIVVPLSHEMHP